MDNDYVFVYFNEINEDETVRMRAKDLSMLAMLSYIRTFYPDLELYPTKDTLYRSVSFIDKDYVVAILPPMKSREPIHAAIVCSYKNANLRSFARAFDDNVGKLLVENYLEPTFMEQHPQLLDADQFTFMAKRLVVTDNNKELFKLIDEAASIQPFTIVK